MKKEKFTDRLTIQQDKFANYLAQGMTQRQAYKKAYPNNKCKNDEVVASSAHKLYLMPKVQRRYEQLLQELREREKTKTGWTREQAIEQLKFVVMMNRKDLERVEKASEEELELLQKMLKEHPDKAPKLLETMLYKRKKSRANVTNNKGITDAVAELNKMLGYNESNINLTGVVVFCGEQELED